ncbi:vitamin B12/cobalamin outer membrane transporter [Mariniflexile rhizosphaerae]|uniref:SusC/RagA family TonB-linked outer membrane protein n=1 Tax=unclassified Mariniflexile TaxID=2643887 RepID=UPI000CC309AF|nr:TonB-dependent receptor [Mariniflexile sp. TRM1-10]AXP81149.1 vitamin B12/cobalamin outer membrane transporter [Mariniflexile sp. TRM1-10]PLB18298.1 MAG: SusC, outer membrane protein involved in starch binding [Flavobacteriaceae bacterium FS1-H7996/R]
MTKFLLFKSEHIKQIGFLILLFLFCTGMHAQITVSGNVSDVDGPIPGANLILKGTNNGAATDFDGNFIISNVPSDGVLVFSFIGYKTKEVLINNRKQINVTLEPDAAALDEVVIIGYGTSKKGSVTGAITTVDAQELERITVPNVAESLRGQAAGVQITKGSGQPGSGVSIKIRGTRSLGAAGTGVDAANQATIVVDGVPLLGGNLSEINPDDIESVTVLKDAASASIYGASGSNGVLLITTKKGKVGKPVFTISTSTGFNNLANRIDFANGDQYIQYLKDVEVGSDIANGVPVSVPSLNTLLSPDQLANYIAGKDVDWQDVLLRQGTTNRVSLTASGGSENFHFYLNGDMYDEKGIALKSDYKRYSYRLNTDYAPNDWLKIGSRIQYTRSEADETSNVIDEFNQNGGFAPFIPISNNTPLGTVYNPDGSLTQFITGDQFQINPLYRYNESIIDRITTRSIVNPYIEISLGGGFKYTINASAEDRNEFYGSFLSSRYKEGEPNEARIQKTNNTSYLLDNIINYTGVFGKHDVTGTFVYGFQQFEFDRLNAIALRLPTDLLGYNGIDDSLDEDDRFSWDKNKSGKVYLIGRVTYGFDDRYILNLSVRRDGSSRFGANNKYGVFPSGSFAWNAHNESFLRDVDVVSNLKLRGSYGITGNDNYSDFRYLALANNIQLPIGVDADGEPILFNGYGPGTTAGNPNLKWEESKQFNVGLDFGLLSNRITGSFEYYQTNNIDLLLPETIIGVANNGATSYDSNIGETETKGLELSLAARIIDTDDFTWSVNMNYTQDRNKLVRLSRNDEDENGNPVDNPANGWFIGQDFREIYDYKYLGVYQTAEVENLNTTGTNFLNVLPGDPKIADLSGPDGIPDGVIDDDDRTFLGNPTPDWFGGITNTFTYKGFELSVLVESVQGVTRVNSFYGGYNSNRSNIININYWTPDNPSNEFPRIGNGGGLSSRFANSIRIRDASFVALRNVSLTYNLPKKFLDKTFVNGLSLYVRGNNLKYFTDYKDAFSPESGPGSYPITKTWVFGTKITF